MARIDVEEVSDGHDDAPRPAAGEVRGGHLGFVAHEIRNPLSTALWTAELLARMSGTERGGARGEKLSAMCLRSIARVRQLVEDHLMTERLDAGGFALRVESLGLAEVVGAVLGRRPADAAAVTVDVDAGLGVDADRALLERAIESLLAAAGAEGVPVSVAARRAAEQIVVDVTGKPADAAALADPVKGSPSDPTGRALGLPLARRIAATLGGELTAGAVGWRLTLPRAGAYTARPSPVPP